MDLRPGILALLFGILINFCQAADRPNIVLILTDDQGYGDLAFHGNPIIKTPNLDRFAKESVILGNFCVSPVCAPTRASLMTGRYNYRTGAVDTYLGRAMMHPEEVTLAEMLGGAGYATGIFGKWHLGDNFPMRPQDQGFQESLVHRGGGVGQPADPPGNRYTDPILYQNGKEIQTSGYCSDLFTDAAVDFIARNHENAFFVYLAFNCPHTPLQVPEESFQAYRKLNFTWEDFPQFGHPLIGKFDPEETAKVYGMVTNIDDNLGRLFETLKANRLEEDTLVMFLTDNGPQQARFTGGFKGKKGSVYEGGIHVPAFIRWPQSLKAGTQVDRPLAHIDVVPTLLDVCGVATPSGVSMDGRSFKDLLFDPASEWPDRNLFFQWHRGDVPQPFRACTVRGPRYKMVQANGSHDESQEFDPVFELYDLQSDPYELKDLSSEKPDLLEELKNDYTKWFEDVSSTRGYEPSRIHLGSDKENPVVLTRQDWRGPQASWGPNALGYWETRVEQERKYGIELLVDPEFGGESAHIRWGDSSLELPLVKGQSKVVFENVLLPRGELRLEPWIQKTDEKVGVLYTKIFF